jgi:hypothetical protein
MVERCTSLLYHSLHAVEGNTSHSEQLFCSRLVASDVSTCAN